MAIVHGKGGSVTFSGLTLTSVQNWSFTSTDNVANTTSMGATWDSFIGGTTTFTANVEALSYTTIDIAALIGTEQALSLFVVSGGTDKIVATNGILQSVTETVSKDDMGKLSMTFACDAATLVYPA